MNQTGDVEESALRVEYDGDVAIINASGDLRSGPAGVFERAMREALEQGYRLVVIDFYDNEGLDEEGIADFAAALKAMLSSDREAEFAIVSHRDSRERERGKLITWDWFMKERSYYSRTEALKGIRQRAGG